MHESQSPVFSLTPFRLDPSQRLVTCDEQPLSLTPKEFDTLLVLVEAAGRVVDKEELINRVWPNTHVGDGSLARNISVLRKTLGEGVIQTHRGRGYRIALPVVKTTSNPVRLPPEPPQQEERDPVASPAEIAIQETSPRWHRGATIGSAIAAALLLAFAGSHFSAIHAAMAKSGATSIHSAVIEKNGAIDTIRAWLGDGVASSTTSPKETANAGPVRIAVLPFHNESHSSDAQELSDGILDDLVDTLAHAQGDTLRILAKGSCLQYRETTKSPAEIAKALGVQYLITGSVTDTLDRAEIKVQLVNGLDQEVRWASQYSGQVSQVRGEVADSVAREVQISLVPNSVVSVLVGDTSNRLAHEAYLRGKLDIERKNFESSHRALRELHNAIALDPKYALAYAGLAELYINFAFNEPTGPSYAYAKESALTAIRLDDRVGEAHRDLAWILDNSEFDWVGGEREYLRALELNPSDARAHHWYAQHLVAEGRMQEALTEVRKGLDLDPLSESSNYNYGFILILSGQFDAAIEHLDNELLREPNSEAVHGYLGLAFRYKGDYENSIREFRRTIELSALKRQYEAALAASLVLGGQAQEARRIASRLRLQWERGVWIPAFNLAVMYFALGDNDEGYQFLRLALRQRSCTLLEINTEPVFLALRGDSRFERIRNEFHLTYMDRAGLGSAVRY
jgi:DNA-binding winged helix-turn-helix (wHTH) protein/TolB-like protein/Tfp pilus assembly protein PilF